MDKTGIKRRYRKRIRRSHASGGELASIAVMAAEGIPKGKIGTALSLTREAVYDALQRPDVQADVEKFRRQLKTIHLAAVSSVAPKAWEKAEAALDKDDAKSWDAYTRGLHAVEKIAASASGENQRMTVEHQGTIDTAPVKVQLQALIALVKSNVSS